MRQVNNDLLLQVDSYRFDNIDDLDGIDASKADQLTVTSRDSRIRLEVGAQAASISADDPDLPTRGMMEEVHRLATRHGREKSWERLRAAINVILLIFAIAMVFVGYTVPGQWPWITSAAAVTLFTFSSLIVRPRKKALVSLKTKSEDPVWLTRNKDALVTNAIVSFVFLIIGIVVGYLLPKQ